jgi:hypothetical protein
MVRESSAGREPTGGQDLSSQVSSSHQLGRSFAVLRSPSGLWTPPCLNSWGIRELNSQCALSRQLCNRNLIESPINFHNVFLYNMLAGKLPTAANPSIVEFKCSVLNPPQALNS